MGRFSTGIGCAQRDPADVSSVTWHGFPITPCNQSCNPLCKQSCNQFRNPLCKRSCKQSSKRSSKRSCRPWRRRGAHRARQRPQPFRRRRHRGVRAGPYPGRGRGRGRAGTPAGAGAYRRGCGLAQPRGRADGGRLRGTGRAAGGGVGRGHRVGRAYVVACAAGPGPASCCASSDNSSYVGAEPCGGGPVTEPCRGGLLLRGGDRLAPCDDGPAPVRGAPARHLTPGPCAGPRGGSFGRFVGAAFAGSGSRGPVGAGRSRLAGAAPGVAPAQVRPGAEDAGRAQCRSGCCSGVRRDALLVRAPRFRTRSGAGRRGRAHARGGDGRVR